jgi:hypothetical protein
MAKFDSARVSCFKQKAWWTMAIHQAFQFNEAA